MVSSRKEIRDSVLDTTRQDNAQIGSLVNDFINMTLNEINDPGWAYPNREFSHLWSWLRKKDTLTVSTADYVLPRDVDRIALMRQTATPIKLSQIEDHRFFDLVPNPTATGNPRYYRMWETEGVSTRLAVADTIDVVSSSASDAGSAENAVTVVGYSSGILTSEAYQLNGLTSVSGTVTFDARDVYVSKQKQTVGNITVKENSGGTTLVVIGKEERNPRFKIVTFYPTPSTSLSVYIEYYTRIRELTNDSDCPGFDGKWHYVVRLGAIAKVYQYLNKMEEFLGAQALYGAAVRGMVSGDTVNPDLIVHLAPQRDKMPFIHQKRSEDVVS